MRSLVAAGSLLLLLGCAQNGRDFFADSGVCPSELHVGYGRISSKGVLDPEVMLPTEGHKKHHKGPENTKWRIGGDSNMGTVTLVFDLTGKRCASD